MICHFFNGFERNSQEACQISLATNFAVLLLLLLLCKQQLQCSRHCDLMSLYAAKDLSMKSKGCIKSLVIRDFSETDLNCSALNWTTFFSKERSLNKYPKYSECKREFQQFWTWLNTKWRNKLCKHSKPTINKLSDIADIPTVVSTKNRNNILGGNVYICSIKVQQ